MKTYNSIEELPISLNVSDVAAYLNISKAYAYQLVNKEDFPTLKIGTRLLIPRDSFINWVRENTRKYKK